MSQIAEQSLTPPTPSPAPRENLARKTGHGMLWLMAQTLSSKMAQLVGQVILAKLLIPNDFGLWAKAAAVMAFVGLLQQAGLKEILTVRHARYNRWANTAFWMSLALGLLGGLVMAIAAWPMSQLPNSEGLMGLMLVLAGSMPLAYLDLVAEARLQTQMRFGLIAGVNSLVAILRVLLSIAFAMMGLGPYAFVLPQPIVSAVRLIILWSVARPPVRMNPQFKRWKYLYSDSLTLFLSNLFLQLQMQGDYLVLWAFSANEDLGFYFMAFNLSIAAMQLFTGNMSGVLFPALTKLSGDPTRQIRAFLDATRLLAIVAVPMCFIQMAIGEPLIRLFFQDAKWQAAIPAFQALSVGMAFRVVASPGGSLLQAQRRFGVALGVNIVNAFLFLSLALLGVWIGESYQHMSNWYDPSSTVGVAVGLYYAIVGPLFMHIVIKPCGGTWRDVIRAYGAPMVCSILAVIPAIAAGWMVPVEQIRGHRWGQLARLMVILTWAVALYVPLVRLTANGAWASLVSRLASLIKKNAPLPPEPEPEPALVK